MSDAVVPSNLLPGFNEQVILAARSGPNADVLRELIETQAQVQRLDPSVEAVSEAIRLEASLVVLTEEVLADTAVAVNLGDRLNQQPDWSDLPVIILLSECQRFYDCLALLTKTTHQRSVMLLETPIKRPIFLSIVGTCLQNRRRQYKLRNTLYQLKESNKALENFSYTAAHELRNPLGVMTTSFDLLARASLESRQGKIVEMGQRTSKRMNRILDALLDYSKVQADEDEFSAVNMEAVVSEAVSSLQVLIQQRNAEFNWTTPLPVVRGNAPLLIQLVTNLVKNAIVHNSAAVPVVNFSAQMQSSDLGQFSPPPSKRYLSEVLSKTAVAQPKRCLFAIGDNGPGIAPEAQSDIFKMFNRAGTSKSEGSGIGLALCQRVAEQHHSTLQLRSVVGEGSTFFLDLEIAESEHSDD